jgi:hypothetical protein
MSVHLSLVKCQEAIFMNSSGQILYRTTSLNQKPGNGCYEIFRNTGSAGLLEEHSEFHCREVFTTSNSYLLVAHSTTFYQPHKLLTVK